MLKYQSRRLFFIPFLLLVMTLFIIEPVNAAYNISNPRVTNNISTWDCVWFGSYFQTLDSNGVTYNQKTPIKWRVLNTDGNKALLLSDKLLFQAEFQNTVLKKVDWEECTLRTVLNDGFLKDAFTSEEKEALVINDEWGPGDQVFLLSLSDVTNSAYGFSSDDGESDARDAGGTAYYYSLGKERYWWLRDTVSYKAANVCAWGVIRSGYYNNDNCFGVRPALVLDLSKSVWHYAGTVSSDGSVNERSIAEQTDASKPAANSGSAKSSSSSKDKTNTYTVGAFSYTLNKKAATITALKSKKAKKVNIPATVKINGKSIPVTAIAPKAFKGMKNLTGVTIGKNVKKIGKNAFYGCKKLNKITIKTSKLTKNSVGANAFKGISKKAVIKCPKAKKAAYKKFLLKKGMKKTMTFR